MSRTPYFPVDCDFHRHPKFVLLRELAGLAYPCCLELWLRIGAHCVEARTAGYITTAQLREICPRPRTLKTRLKLLTETRLVDEGPDGTYSMHNWADRNFSAEELADIKATRKERNRRYYEKTREKVGGSRRGSRRGRRPASLAEVASSNEVYEAETGNPGPVRTVLKNGQDAYLTLNKTSVLNHTGSSVSGIQKVSDDLTHLKDLTVGQASELASDFGFTPIPPSIYPQLRVLAPFSRAEVDYARAETVSGGSRKGLYFGKALITEATRREAMATNDVPSVSRVTCDSRKSFQRIRLEEEIAFAKAAQVHRNASK